MPSIADPLLCNLGFPVVVLKDDRMPTGSVIMVQNGQALPGSVAMMQDGNVIGYVKGLDISKMEDVTTMLPPKPNKKQKTRYDFILGK